MRHRRRFALRVMLPALLALATVVAVLASHGARAGAPAHGSTPSCTTQTRLGCPAGNDWEPALAADRYSHVYALYEHYDVP